MGDFEYCAACLVADVKMYNLATKHTSNSSSTVGQSFSQLLQISHAWAGSPGELPPSHRKPVIEPVKTGHFYDFKTRCLNVQSILSNLVDVDDPEKIKEIIQNVDRDFCKSTSNLMFSYAITNIDGEYVEDLKTVNVKPNMNLALNKTVVEEKTTTKKKFIKHVNTNGEDESDYEDATNVNENDDMMTDSDTQYKSNLQYINYSDKDSLGSPPDNVLFSKHNTNSAQAAVSNITKRKIKDNINSEDEYSSEEEPLSKLFKTLEENHTEKRYSKISDTKVFEGFITVVELSLEDVEKEILLRKESTSYKRSKFQCGICYKGYATKTAYENHMKRHSPMSEKFTIGNYRNINVQIMHR